MRDPIGVCCRVERLCIAQAQSDRHCNPKLKEDAEGGKPYDQVRISTVKIKDTGKYYLRVDGVALLTFSPRESSKTKESQKPSGLPERPRSCSGRIEILASHKPLNEYKQSLPNAQGPKVASLRSLFESIFKQGLKPTRPQSLPGPSPVKQLYLRASEELDRASIDKQHAIRVQTEGTLQDHDKRPDAEVTSDTPDGRSVVHASESKSNPVTGQNVHEPECDETSKNEPPMELKEKLPDPPVKFGKKLPVSFEAVVPIRTRSQNLGRNPLQVASHLTRVEKRMTEREEEELEAMVSRKTKRRFKITTTSAQSTIVAETRKPFQYDSSFTPAPPRFWESSE